MWTSRFLVTAFVAGFYGSFACEAQSSEEVRVAHVLTTDFETAVYTDSRFLLNFKDDGESEDSLLGMRLPYVEWMAALKHLSLSAEDDLEKAYGAIAVGAKNLKAQWASGWLDPAIVTSRYSRARASLISEAILPALR